MSSALVFAFSLTSMCGLGPEVPAPSAVFATLRQARNFEELYKSGITFADFLEQAED